MRLHVVHETHYSYASPVLLSQQLMHLAPRELPWQACHAHRLSIEPQPGEFAESADFFGNRIARLLISVPHEDLLVRAASTLDVAPREKAALALPRSPWEAVRASSVAEAAAFLYESPHVETWRELVDYAAASFPPRRPVLEGAMHLSHRIYQDFEFDKTASSVSIENATPMALLHSAGSAPPAMTAAMISVHRKFVYPSTRSPGL